MNSYSAPAPKRQKHSHLYNGMSELYHFNRPMPNNLQSRTLCPPTPVTLGQFVNMTGTEQLVTSPFSNDYFASQNALLYSSSGLFFPGCYTTTPADIYFQNFEYYSPARANLFFDGLPTSTICQQLPDFQLPGSSNHANYSEIVLPTPVTEKAPATFNSLPAEDLPDEPISHDDLKEAPQPKFIETPLRRHQKQALTFMLQRERGRTSSDEGPGVWKTTNTKDGPAFLNRVTNVGQPQQPPPCYGGIIADPMGFGKTISMLSLLARDVEDGYGEQGIDEEGLPKIQTTLIVVPLSLIHNWEKELSKHVKKGRLAHHIHLQGDTLPPIEQLKKINVIFTTYDRVRTEWKSTKKSRPSMFSVSWRRIILDEAHRVRNRKSQEYEAIYKLKSTSRWAVTGTPIQNHLGDLASLFSFIRAHPCNDEECFEEDISRRWRSGSSLEALVRLRRLIKCLVLRRDVEMLALPTREDIQLEVDFTADERDLYDEKVRALGNIVNSDRKGKLQEIGELRQVCNLGLYYKTGQGEASNASKPHKDMKLSSKVHALIEHIRALSSGEKCLVFSSWRKTLDSIEIGLEHSSIPSVRFDGTVPQKERQRIVDEFRSKGEIRVMLLTLACGAEGLNVTEATRVYLMEPNWNPNLEEQALSRVWRIGQQHPVTTVRLLMRDSIEAEVVEKQKLKRKLTQLLFPSHDDGNAAEDEESLKKLIPII